MKCLLLVSLLLTGCVTGPHTAQDCDDQGRVNANFGMIGLFATTHCYVTVDESATGNRSPFRPSRSGSIESKDYAEPEALCAQGLDAYCEAKEASRRNTAHDPKPRDAKLCAEGYDVYC